ncbi:ABC transporter permease [Thiohalobacter sp.]|uniref:ABC transporter permease n=1 Tax=Thiohalobacter sp. TaxID=2025948 RepID=UPI0026274B5D|nr:FtsX-like permease family protein [Thiohalobacter sp.]
MRSDARLALRWLARDARAGELQLLAASLVLAVAVTLLIGLAADRLQRGLSLQGTELLGADLVLRSPTPVPEDWLQRATALGLARSATLEFASVVSTGEAFQLASVRAVDDAFPLRGESRSAATPHGEDRPATPPRPGTVWIEARLGSLLGVGIGDALQVGAATLRVVAFLGHEPSRSGDFFNMSPRLLMHLDDLPATRVVQPGSRVHWRHFVAGPRPALEAWKAWLTPQLAPGQTLVDVRSGRPLVGDALQRAEGFLSLASLATVALAGVAIGLAARRHARRHLDGAALIRCFGHPARRILRLFLLQYLMLGLAAGMLGCLLGWGLQAGLFAWLGERIPQAPAELSAGRLLFALLLAPLMLLAFALPPLLSLPRTPALRVLDRELTPTPVNAWLTRGSALALVAGLLLAQLGDVRLAALLLGGLTAAALLGLAAIRGLLALLARAPWPAGFAPRLARRGLVSQPWLTSAQLLGFTLTLLVLALALVLRADLIRDWQTRLPPDAPNHFALNLLDHQVEPFAQQLAAAGIAHSGLYPIVRGRLVARNGQPMRAAVTKEEGNDEALRRELNLTWQDHLPEGNRLVAGRWFGSADTAEVSVESRLAHRLGIGLGDRLTFTIGGRQLTATVTSIREVDWESFRPNFYMIFPPGVLDGLPQTWLTAFRIEPGNKHLLGPLVAAFPNVTLLEVDRMIAQVQGLLDHALAAMTVLLLFVLAAGLLVLAAVTLATLDARLRTGALLRSFGATRARIRAWQLWEFLLLGLIAGGLAAVGSELLLALVYARGLDLAPRLRPLPWLLIPAAGVLLTLALGLLTGRRVVRHPPLHLLGGQR